MKTHKNISAFFSNSWAEREYRFLYLALTPDAQEGLKKLTTEAATNDEALNCLRRILNESETIRNLTLEAIHLTGVTHIRETAAEKAERLKKEAEAGKSAVEATESLEKTKATAEKEKDKRKLEEINRKQRENEAKLKKEKEKSWLGLGLENPSEKQLRNRFALGTAGVGAATGVIAAAQPVLKGVPILGYTSAELVNAWSAVGSGISSIYSMITSGGILAGGASVLAMLTAATGSVWLLGKAMAAHLRKKYELLPDSDPNKARMLAKLNKYGAKEHLILGATAPGHLAKKVLDFFPNTAGSTTAYAIEGASKTVNFGKKAVVETTKLGGKTLTWGGIAGIGTAVVTAPFGGAALALPAALAGGAYGAYRYFKKK